MEDIHGIDVSWLHHSNREHHRQHAPSSPALPRDAVPNVPPLDGSAHEHTENLRTEPTRPVERLQQPVPPSISIPPAARTSSKRPALLGRSSSERIPTSPHPDGKTPSRRNSWISSISSKFSLPQSSPGQAPNSPGPQSPGPTLGLQSTTSSTNTTANGKFSTSGNPEAVSDGNVTQPAKGSFLSNALRRLSSGTQVGTLGKTVPNGGQCPRRVMNVDPHRPRCLVPELDQNKLRRVAFCVDVEIASGPRYKDELDNEEKKKKKKEKKLKERGEGEALKHPDLVAEEKDADGVIRVSDVQEAVGTEEAPNPEGTLLDGEKKEQTKKKEKKKKSEAERKERKEKRRRKAEENGQIPLELTREDDDDDASPDRNSIPSKAQSIRAQDRPTTDPLRIYRRCCQLREAPILKRICDQLSAPSVRLASEPGVVTCLDLTGSRLQLSDIVTLGDWLAVVPVKKLILEDADLTDEKSRVILAGLLAAKVQEAPRRRRTSQDKLSVNGENQIQERTGCVEKLSLKNNPKITREGWKHICLFLYMCKSIKGIDVSMIPFPEALDQPALNSNGVARVKPSNPADIAETLCKSLSERLGGSRLEELVMAECSLKSKSIRRIVDGAVMSGVQRLGLAGNDIDDEGLDYVLHYIRSGVCQGLDLGGNDLRNGIGRLADGLTKDCPLWALCLADCDLTTDLLRPLFAALTTLPNFRFLDLSHNRDLFSNNRSLCILRKYIPQLTDLKRLHLIDVSMTPAQAIGLAEVLPECPQLAHISIVENPQISALSVATDEASQEEAAALYASLMAAARVSRTLIRVDVDVPSPEQSEVVKALAKQVVAYCLRNMETITEIPELKEAQKEVEIPDVLLNLVGHTEDSRVSKDHSEPLPDDDYIVGGTGVVKALSYCLLQKASDSRRTSLPASGTATPRMEPENEHVKAKTMSTNLLGSARNIRSRLQPALVREAQSGNDFAYRRLLFLDQTLQGMIQRFEDEFPETRLPHPDGASITSSQLSTSPPTSASQILSASATDTERTWTTSGDFSDDEEPRVLRSRHNSDVSLASRALSLEEGRIHRLGHRVRTEILNATEGPPSPPSSPTDTHAPSSLPSDPRSTSTHETDADSDTDSRLLALRSKLESLSGEDLRQLSKTLAPEEAFQRLSDNADELKRLVSENPGDFERFKASQIAALKNRRLDDGGGGGGVKDKEGKGGDDCAVED